MPASKMLNIGCGGTFHPDWVNLDVAPADPNVLTVNINNGLPFPSESAIACYSSHVLEHLDKAGARDLIAECFRVLKRGGVYYRIYSCLGFYIGSVKRDAMQ